MRGKGGWWFRVLAAVVIAVAGWVSNAVSRPACLRNAAFWHTHVLSASGPFYLQLGSDPAIEQAAFDSIQAPYQLLPADAGANTYPRVHVADHAPIPWVTSVTIVYERSPGLEYTFTAHYVCVFGLVFSAGDSFSL